AAAPADRRRARRLRGGRAALRGLPRAGIGGGLAFRACRQSVGRSWRYAGHLLAGSKTSASDPKSSNRLSTSFIAVGGVPSGKKRLPLPITKGWTRKRYSSIRPVPISD